MAKIRKNTKQYKINKAYNRAYSNLKARIRAQEKQGYYGYSMPAKVKKPTMASINRLNAIKAKDIREKSVTTVSPTTGEIVTPYELRVEASKRRSEIGKKSAITRKQKSVPQSPFKDRVDNYFPTKQEIQTYNLVNDVISHVVPKDFYEELLDMVRQAKNEAEWHNAGHEMRWRGKHSASKYTAIDNLRERSANVIESQIRKIIRDKQANKTYYKMIEHGDKDWLMRALEKALYGYNEDEITEGRTVVMAILSAGMVTEAKYHRMLQESDDEA